MRAVTHVAGHERSNIPADQNNRTVGEVSLQLQAREIDSDNTTHYSIERTIEQIKYTNKSYCQALAWPNWPSSCET